jgi:hypothetical protein
VAHSLDGELVMHWSASFRGAQRTTSSSDSCSRRGFWCQLTSRAFSSGGFNAEWGRLLVLLSAEVAKVRRSGKAELQLAVDACKLWCSTSVQY